MKPTHDPLAKWCEDVKSLGDTLNKNLEAFRESVGQQCAINSDIEKQLSFIRRRLKRLEHKVLFGGS